MSHAQTATGQLAFDAMDRTLIHEHVHVAMPGWQFDLQAPKPVRHEMIARAVDKLHELQAHGCHTIVDPCPMDLGRDVEFVAEVAQRSGTNIIVATGVYTEADGMPSTFRTLPDDDILAFYMKEIVDGIGETGIKAGVVKIASGPDPANAYEARMIGIAAKAARLTGVPLISHTHIATHGHDQLDIVEAHGGRADCMVVGHSGDRDDHAYQRSLAERGAFVGLDRFGLEMDLSDDLRIKNLIELAESGHRDRILVSHDHALCLLGRMSERMAAIAPNWKITRIFDYVIPQLRRCGMSDAEIDEILIDNPKALFRNASRQIADRRESDPALVGAID